MKTSMEQHKACVLCAILLGLMTGCKSEQTARTATINPPVIQPTPDVTPDPKPNPEPPVEWIPSTPLEPSTPIAPETPETPEPPKPTLPTFISEGITTHTQSPYSGTVTRGGDNYLRYNATEIAKTARTYNSADFQNFELPKWTVDYKYEPFLEVVLTNGAETLCARYSWKKGGFGYAKPHCLWSDTRAVMPLEDMKSAYYGYSVVESRVWVNGVVGLEVGVSM